MVSVEMAITINLSNRLKPKQEQWLIKNVGPVMFYLHNSVGGQGWVYKQMPFQSYDSSGHTLTFEDEKLATFFAIKFSS
jgi:hypothetical protein